MSLSKTCYAVAVAVLTFSTLVIDTASAGADAAVSVPKVVRAADPTPLPTVTQPESTKYQYVHMSINSLHRDSSGLVTLTYTAFNSGPGAYYPNADLVSPFDFRVPSSDKVTLTDEAAKLRYRALQMIPSRNCTCTEVGHVRGGVNQGQQAIFFNTYKLPANITKVTVSIPGNADAKNVPIS